MDNKAMEEGMTLLIETVRRLVEKEIPIKLAEAFDTETNASAELPPGFAAGL